MPWGQWAEGEKSGRGDFSRAGLTAKEQRCREETGATVWGHKGNAFSADPRKKIIWGTGKKRP